MQTLRQRAALAALIWLLLASACAAQAEDDCTCDLSGPRRLVCADGITFESECIARCQGVAVAKQAPCRAIDARMFADAGATPAAAAAGGAVVVDSFTINRYKDEGFLFVGFGKADPDGMPTAPRLIGGPSRKPAKLSAAAVRYVYATGHLYRTTSAGSLLAAEARAAAANAGADDGGAAVWPAFDPTVHLSSSPAVDVANIMDTPNASVDASSTNDPAATTTGARRLLGAVDPSNVFGGDDRVRQTPTNSYPWSAHGLITFKVSSSMGGGCSGAMITESSVLTAAHCVHGGKGGAWFSDIAFAPGADGSARPYGTIAWETATIYQEWINNGCNGTCTEAQFARDMAVIKLTDAIGPRTGTLGMKPCNNFSTSVTTAGYPGDKSSGTMWRTSCNISDDNGADAIIRTTACDTIQGQSGSPVWETSTRLVYGIVSFGSSSYNGFQQMNTQRFWDAIAWSGSFATPWNDAGQNDGLRSIYLDRHTPGERCFGSLTALGSFQLQTRYNPTNIRVAYGCRPLRTSLLGAAVRYTTPANDWGGGNTVFFDRHNLRCPAKTAMSRWHLFRPSSNQIAFEFWCAPVTLKASTCKKLATGLNDQGAGKVVFLDRHSVACPGERVLTGWTLSRNGTASNFRIEYTCCGV